MCKMADDVTNAFLAFLNSSYSLDIWFVKNLYEDTW